MIPGVLNSKALKSMFRQKWQMEVYKWRAIVNL